MNDSLTLIDNFVQDCATSLNMVPLDRVSCFLLLIVAAGGVLCALFGKKSLLNQGICCTLELMVLYLVAAIVCTWFPAMQKYADFPFLSVTELATEVVSPLSLNFQQLTAALVRFLFLVFAIGLADMLLINSQNFGTWLCTQLLSLLASVLLYGALTSCIELLAPALMHQWSPAFLLGLVLLIAILLGASAVSGEKGKKGSAKLHTVLTSTRGGALLCVCAIAFMLFLVLLVYLSLMQLSTWKPQQVRSAGFSLTAFLCMSVLCIFSSLFYDRKKT